ncbi:Cysteine and histidine-rich domain-containing protein RAR1 [Striga hermonthica]|uniref:Cysteine and histidine-rich domain-containing protein RAR1 n=1 Tax=Striga hermonthica TaxID=68872 RepID=A0A9N7R3K1_STRHE|nr:Cysteine and histidine-rich domain-containing protein RAR1 [Striga hermonthica]
MATGNTGRRHTQREPVRMPADPNQVEVAGKTPARQHCGQKSTPTKQREDFPKGQERVKNALGIGHWEAQISCGPWAFSLKQCAVPPSLSFSSESSRTVAGKERETMEKVRCQRIGCDAMFSEDDNPDGSCTYHDAPIFHDGMKEWSCCKQRSHDFSLFLEIPGCKTGKHTTEKPVLAKKAPPVQRQLVATQTPTSNASTKDACPRCRQGFFCSDHGSNVRELKPKPAVSECSEANPEPEPPRQKKIVDINQPQICKNKGCGKSFKEKDNHDEACNYHPGPPVFHDRMRGWKCCDIHVKEFDEFMSIPPCTKGWHNPDPVS